MLSLQSKAYDPLGFIAPLILPARLIFQRTCVEKLLWDLPIPPKLAERWRQWLEGMKVLPKLRYKRCLVPYPQDDVQVEVHIFADASEVGFGAVSYVKSWGLPQEDGKREAIIRFGSAKSRVAPSKSNFTIPRLELLGALEAIKLAKTLAKGMEDIKPKFFFYSDSQTVLSWLRNTQRKLYQFVANRVKRILNFSEVDSWHYVATKDNPADIASRGATPQELLDSELWWEGPAFLKVPPEELPKERVLQEPEDPQEREDFLKECKPEVEHNFHVADEKKVKLTDVGSWAKGAAAMEHLLQSKWGKKCRQFEGGGETALIKILQAEAFPELLATLQKVRSRLPATPNGTSEGASIGSVYLPAKHPLAKFKPTLDEEGVIRLQGRLRAAEGLELGLRNPALLEKTHPLTTRLIRQLHEDLHHAGGPGTVLALLNQKYWFYGANRLVKKVIKSCVICARVHTKKGEAVPDPPLPKFRIPEGSLTPFKSTAMDVAGPFLTTEGRGKALKKRYLLLLNCLQTRAVHLELLYSLEADSFLLAFERFIATRGRPEFILTDNGTNFQRGEREIRDLIAMAEKDSRFKPIKWFFIPPLTPTWNGVSERLIQAAKRALRTVIGEEPRSVEVLHTAFSITMGILNNRPLTPPSDDPRDPTPLTPNHFLSNAQYISIGPTPIEEWSFSKRWLETQKLADHLWRRFVAEFLPTLQGHRKWSDGGRELAVGDIVVMLDRRQKGRWGIGRIIKVFPSPIDGRVRSFEVLDGANGNVYRRALHQVYRLDLNEKTVTLPKTASNAEHEQDEPVLRQHAALAEEQDAEDGLLHDVALRAEVEEQGHEMEEGIQSEEDTKKKGKKCSSTKGRVPNIPLNAHDD